MWDDDPPLGFVEGGHGTTLAMYDRNLFSEAFNRRVYVVHGDDCVHVFDTDGNLVNEPTNFVTNGRQALNGDHSFLEDWKEDYYRLAVPDDDGFKDLPPGKSQLRGGLLQHMPPGGQPPAGMAEEEEGGGEDLVEGEGEGKANEEAVEERVAADEGGEERGEGEGEGEGTANEAAVEERVAEDEGGERVVEERPTEQQQQQQQQEEEKPPEQQQQQEGKPPEQQQQQEEKPPEQQQQEEKPPEQQQEEHAVMVRAGDRWTYTGKPGFVYRVSKGFVGFIFDDSLLWVSVASEQFRAAGQKRPAELCGVQAVLYDKKAPGSSAKLPCAFLINAVEPEGLTAAAGWRCFREFQPPPFSVDPEVNARYGPSPFASQLQASMPVRLTGVSASIRKGDSQTAKPATTDGLFVAVCLGTEHSGGSKETRRYALHKFGGKLFLTPLDAFETRRAEVQETLAEGEVATACHSVFTGRSPVAVHSSLGVQRIEVGPNLRKGVAPPTRFTPSPQDPGRSPILSLPPPLPPLHPCCLPCSWAYRGNSGNTRSQDSAPREVKWSG